jgi:hypothetical protein
MSSSKKGIGVSSVPTTTGTIKEAFNTRLRSNDPTTAEAKEIREDKKQDIRLEEEGKNYLPDSPYQVDGEPSTLESLADTLFLVSRACKGQSNGVTKALVNTIRSIAFIIKAADENDREPSLTALINDNIDTHLSSATDSFKTSMDTAIEKSSKAIIENLDKYISMIKGNLQQIMSSVQSYSDTLKNARPQCSRIRGHMGGSRRGRRPPRR